jgi:hypothetical protein
MQYRAPPLPVDFKNVGAALQSMEESASTLASSNSDRKDEFDEDAQFQQFRMMAKNKYNIRTS